MASKKPNQNKKTLRLHITIFLVNNMLYEVLISCQSNCENLKLSIKIGRRIYVLGPGT